jgi:hypothetical protein
MVMSDRRHHGRASAVSCETGAPMENSPPEIHAIAGAGGSLGDLEEMSMVARNDPVAGALSMAWRKKKYERKPTASDTNRNEKELFRRRSFPLDSIEQRTSTS